jgi:curved DNA-binding protein CbpA
MTTPYQILGVSETSTDAEIKLAYLLQVKANPPDRDQYRFQQIQQAYEAIKDYDSRLRYALFHVPIVIFDELLEHAFQQNSTLAPLSADDFLKLLHAAPVEKSLISAFLAKS